MFGQILFVDTMGADEFQGVGAPLGSELQGVGHRDFALQKERSDDAGELFATDAHSLSCGIGLLYGEVSALLIEQFQKVFLQFFLVGRLVFLQRAVGQREEVDGTLNGFYHVWGLSISCKGRDFIGRRYAFKEVYMQLL